MSRDTILGDRRLRRRYPIELDLEFKFIKDHQIVSTGAGRTENISSGGILFHTADRVACGPSVEITIRFPTVWGDALCLELCVSGRLVRQDSNGTAVRVSRYHFQKLDGLRAGCTELFSDTVVQ